MNISQHVGDQMKTNWHPFHIGFFPLQSEPTSKQAAAPLCNRAVLEGKFKSLFGWVSTSVVQLFEFFKESSILAFLIIQNDNCQ
jgi:hypothetical protein